MAASSHTKTPHGVPYAVKVSPRATHVRLRMSPEAGLVVVVPRGFPRREIPQVLEAHRAWIERTTARIEAQRAALAPELTSARPTRIALAAIGREFAVQYTPSDCAHIKARIYDGDRLVVSGAVQDDALCRRVLALWLRRTAEQHLIPWLVRVASEKGFVVSRVIVRSQRTRWASCSRRGTVSLNQRMMLLPPALVEYLFIHELCHTVHMNHSPQFWALVASHVPDHRQQEQHLQAAWRAVPDWA